MSGSKGQRPSGWPAPFLLAKEILEPVFFAAGLRFVAIDRGEGREGHAFAEYSRRGERIRLVWEGTERVLWLESAPERDAQIIGRWTDVEWILAGARRPLNPDTGDERMAELAEALAEYLVRAGGARIPAIPTLTVPEPDDDD
jgi:hypothetical protein